MDQIFKVMFSAVAIVLTLTAFIPYIRSILGGSTKPHLFSWVIWSLITTIIFFAQLDADGGIGAWPIGISAAITTYIAWLAFTKRADISITRIDWLFLLSSLGSLPLWYFSSDPMWTVILLTVVDLLGFGPTISKAYDFPHEESITFFLMFLLRNIFTLLALEAYSITTILFPLAVSCACILLCALVIHRRKIVYVHSG